MSTKIRTKIYKKRYFALFAFLISILIIFGSLYFYKGYSKFIKTEKSVELRAISDLKSEQIAEWKRERTSDAVFFSQSRLMWLEFEKFIKNTPDKPTIKEISDLLRLTKESHEYVDMRLLSVKGEVLFSFNNEKNLDEYVIPFIKKCINEKQVVYTDLYFCNIHKEIHYDIISPLINDKKEVFGVLLLRINPYIYLYPMIQSWPTPSKSAETLILKKVGDEVVYLNDLRHKDSSALKLKFPLTQKDLPAVQAVSGLVGIFEGKDYRGIEVLSDVRKIPNTNWYMVSKVDTDEIFKELKLISSLTTIFIITLILIVIAGLALLYNLRQKGIYRELYNTEKKYIHAQEEFKTTLYSIGDAVITTDLKGLVNHMNHIAENLTGWKEKSALGKPLSEIFNIINEENRRAVENPVEKVLKEGMIVGLANHTLLVSKDGKETPIADSGAPIKNEDGEITGVVLVFRDQTEERESRKRIEYSEKKFRGLFASTNEGICLHELILEKGGDPIDYKILDVNRKYEELIGFKKEEVVGKLATDIYQTDIAPYLGLYSKVALTGKSESFETYYEPMKRYFDVSVYSPEKGKFATVFQDITEKKLAEEMIEQQYHTLRGINESVKSAIFSVDREYRYASFNTPHAKMMKTIYGVDIEFGKCLLDYMTVEEDREIARNNFDRVFKGESFVVKSYSGDEGINRLYFEVSHSPIMNDEGKVVGAAVFASDISERKQMENKLSESESKFISVYKNSPVAIAIFSIDDGKFVDVNNVFLKETGYDKDEVIGKTSKELKAFYDYNDREKLFKKLMNGEAVYGEDVKLMKKNGEVRECLISINIINMEGKPHFIASIEDITERKKVEESLKESEARLNAFMEYVPALILIKDEQLRPIYANNKFKELFSFDEWYFKTPHQTFNKDIADTMVKMDEHAFDKGFVEYEEEWKDKYGNTNLYQTQKFKIEIKERSPLLGAIITDITEKKHVETIQKLQYNIANSVVNSRNLHELFKTVSVELNNLIYTSNFFAALYDEETGMLYTPFEKGKEDEPEKWKAEKSLTGLVIQEKKSILLNKDQIQKLADEGKIEFIGRRSESWLGVPLKIGQKVLGAIVIQDYNVKKAYDTNSIEIMEMIAHEISIYIEHKKAEEVANRLSKGIEQSPICIVVTDIGGTIEYVNPKFTEVTGYSVKEVMGENPRVLKSGEQSNEYYKDMWQTIMSGKDWQGELHNRKKNGELYWESAIISPIFDEDKKITHFIAIKEDITEKKKMIGDLVAAKENAEELNRLKSSFLANMSHELRTPLNGILGFAEILKDDLKDEDSKNMAQIIFKSGKRLHNTLNQILNLTTLQSEVAKVMKANINVNKVVAESFSLYKAEALKKNLDFRFESAENEIVLFTDRNILLNSINNLVDNAIKYTHEGKVIIKLFEEKADGHENIVIEVSDTGIGIEKENQQIIFDEFRQVSEGYSRSFEGTGLGLSICKKYMKLLGGNIKVKSELYKGSTFRIEMPKLRGTSVSEIAEQDKLPDKVSMNSDSIKPKKYNKKILYVENDIDNQELIKIAFRDYVNIDMADNAIEGIKLARENDYAVILMDINLGSGMNGKDVVKLLRKNPKYENTPIIAVTAFAMEGDKEEFIESGCTHYMSKPFEVDVMHKLIFGLLEEK